MRRTAARPCSRSVVVVALAHTTCFSFVTRDRYAPLDGRHLIRRIVITIRRPAGPPALPPTPGPAPSRRPARSLAGPRAEFYQNSAEFYQNWSEFYQPGPSVPDPERRRTVNASDRRTACRAVALAHS
jgi:hypothetical protein